MITWTEPTEPAPPTRLVTLLIERGGATRTATIADLRSALASLSQEAREVLGDGLYAQAQAEKARADAAESSLRAWRPVMMAAAEASTSCGCHAIVRLSDAARAAIDAGGVR